ncbi:hypothetical protein BVG79_00187 [Ketogulonicigenium robustum]|uniref:Uncharacterized protein n=1 Tax=Ketogulonicigenium robustum TaxID=92947 RepID=A0A1W6NX14_9RHOB|nr:hypothetical protein [Ketogulonicigenium robustum]ARO13547.1 hypothetical protein BVG79_00187 [Ketogulonicigenium robustum]
MSLSRRSLVTEFGTALAVLTLWLLAIVSPLHQVSAFAHEAGISTVWTICEVPQEHGSSSHDPVMMACPMHGMGKGHTALLLPVFAGLHLYTTTFTILTTRLYEARLWARIQPHPVQPRAPPGLV